MRNPQRYDEPTRGIYPEAAKSGLTARLAAVVLVPVARTCNRIGGLVGKGVGFGQPLFCWWRNEVTADLR